MKRPHSPSPLLATRRRLPSVTDRDVLEYLLLALDPEARVMPRIVESRGRWFRFTPKGALAEISSAPSRKEAPL